MAFSSRERGDLSKTNAKSNAARFAHMGGAARRESYRSKPRWGCRESMRSEFIALVTVRRA